MDTKLNKQWAIKEIKPVDSPTEREIIRKSLVTETNIMKRLDHPALPRITDLINEGGKLYVVMDYIEGEPLSRILKEQGPQAQEDVIEWGKQLCDVLDYLHAQDPPIIYRDMKPGNVMLKPDGTVKIIDFGIARQYREESQEQKGRADDTTMLGTRGYAAPEQFGGLGQTDARTDVYCLGATMYHLLTGKSPADPPYVMHPIRQVDATLSPGLESIVSKATQQNPDKRYSSCAEMLYELENYETVDDAHRKRLKGTWHLFLGVCAAAAACVVIGIAALIGAQVTRQSDYSTQIELAEAETSQAQAAGHYLSAISISPGDTQAYLGLIALYKQDGSFSTAEEAQLLSVVTPNLAHLQSDSGSYAALSYEIGKLYWYYYDYASDAGENRLTRIKSASKWMKDAASYDGFSNQALAQVYAGIAAFNNDIVARINEGGDEGSYEPYFHNLQKLNDMVSDEGNDVVLLETSSLTTDALQVYARKFRADGITRVEMEALGEKAVSNARGVHPTTTKLDLEQESILAGEMVVRTAIGDAFIDARSLS